MSEDGHSLSARVFHTLREEILSGKYQKDEELKEKTIGEELGVSRTPVREALRQLGVRRFSHDNSKPGELLWREYPKMISRTSMRSVPF